MSFFARFERVCALLIERTFAKTFPSDVEPAQIARKLVATMEAQSRGDGGHRTAPPAYAVYVSPADYERLADHREYLERAWADLLQELAGKVGIAFQGDVRVTMAPRESVPLGAIAVEPAGEEKPAHFSLRMLKGVPPDGVYAIQGSARVGRSEQSEIVLVDPSVSRAHAIVDIATGEPVVRDLDSTNGTFVNGRRVRAQTLRDGDELLFGNTRMRFESG